VGFLKLLLGHSPPGKTEFIRKLAKTRIREDADLQSAGVGEGVIDEMSDLDVLGLPEGTIVTIVETWATLNRSGVPEAEIFDRIEQHRQSLGDSGRVPSPLTLASYVRYRVRLEHGDEAVIDDTFIDFTIEEAKKWLAGEVGQGRAGGEPQGHRSNPILGFLRGLFGSNREQASSRPSQLTPSALSVAMAGLAARFIEGHMEEPICLSRELVPAPEKAAHEIPLLIIFAIETVMATLLERDDARLIVPGYHERLGTALGDYRDALREYRQAARKRNDLGVVDNAALHFSIRVCGEIDTGYCLLGKTILSSTITAASEFVRETAPSCGVRLAGV
jgi:hypothetical protein